MSLENILPAVRVSGGLGGGFPLRAILAHFHLFNPLEKIMNKLRSIRRAAERHAAKLGLVGAAALAFVENAQAALPAEATAAFTTINGNLTDIFAAVWGIAAIATGGWVLLKLFKKGANKAV